MSELQKAHAMMFQRNCDIATLFNIEVQDIGTPCRLILYSKTTFYDMEQNLHYINDIDISEYDAMEDAQIQPEQHSCVL